MWSGAISASGCIGLDAYWLPVPRQEFVEAAGAMTVGHALQDVSEPGKGLDVVELCGGDEGGDGCPSGAATVRAREQMGRLGGAAGCVFGWVGAGPGGGGGA